LEQGCSAENLANKMGVSLGLIRAKLNVAFLSLESFVNGNNLHR